MRHELAQGAAWARQGEQIALARVIAAEGSAPRPIGAALVISASGDFLGSVSGGCVEGAVIAAAATVARTGVAQTLHFRGDADPLTEIALGCGGTATIFIERISLYGEHVEGSLAPVFTSLLCLLEEDAAGSLVTALGPHPQHWLLDSAGRMIAGTEAVMASADVDLFTQPFAGRPRLVVVGADAVGQAVAKLAASLDWRVQVIDPRAGWLTPHRFPLAERRIAWPDEALTALDLDKDVAVVVLSHDPKIDEPALLIALRSPAGYVGALGSRTANSARLTRLRAGGLTAAEVARLHAPVGLDLGGHTPEEMALSIIAEIVAARNGRPGGKLRQGAGPIHALAGSALCAARPGGTE